MKVVTALWRHRQAGARHRIAVGIEVDNRVRARAPPCRLSVPGVTSDQFVGPVFLRCCVRPLPFGSAASMGYG
jgi:hypothetical protein